MTEFLSSVAIAIGESVVLSLIAKVTIVAAAGLAVVGAMRNVRASRKYLVLAWTFVVLGGMPAAALLFEPLTVVVRPVQPAAVPAAVAAPLATDDGELSADALRTTVAVATAERFWFSPDALIASWWAISVLVYLLPMVRTLRRLRRLRRTGWVWKEIGAVTILRHDNVTVPMTFGLLRPVVLMPNDLSDWSDADVDRALVHELEHVRRRDWPVHLFVRFICALYWFHPLVWRAGRRLYLQADLACDDAVVRRGDGEAFADQLVALASRLVEPVPAEVPSMGGGDLYQRVMAIVDPRHGRGRAGVACRLLAGVVAITCGTAIAPLKAVETTSATAAGLGRRTSPADPANQPGAFDRGVPLVASVARREARPNAGSSDASMNRRPPLAAQVPATGSTQAPMREQGGPRFEVVSVKAAPDSTLTSGRYRPEPTRFSGDFSVIDAVAFAYRLEKSRIMDAPQWAKDKRYLITATTPLRKAGDLQAMMRHLLEERFALQVHREQRSLPVYVLRLARADGRFGPKLQQVERDCTPSASTPRPCSASYGVGNYRSSGERWDIFVASLDTGITERPVVDKTGLSGQFDITLDWNPNVELSPADIRQTPALFTALREQLGLTLDSDTAAMDVLVIDSVNRPTPD